MLARYSDAYQEIADSLVPVLPEGWSEARVLAEMRSDDGMVVGFARVDGNPEQVWLDLPRSVSAACRAMYLAARDSGDPKALWTSATVRLSNTGAFDVHYGYDAVPLEDQFERVQEWAKRNA